MKRFAKKISWSYYRYAPESFRLFIDKKEVELDSETKDKLAHLAITGKEKELIDEVKRLFRKKAKQQKKHLLVITKNKDKKHFITFDHIRVNPYNTLEKLLLYKDIKRYLANYNNIQVATLGAKGEVEDVKQSKTHIGKIIGVKLV